jgi:hypothetical protein
MRSRWSGGPKLDGRSCRCKSRQSRLAGIRGLTRAVQKRPAASLGWLGVLLVLASVSACSRHEEAHSQARTLLRALNALSDKHGLAERAAALQALAQLELSEPAVVSARASCRAAHAGLLDAEASQTSARKALELASHSASDAGISGASAAAIAAEIEQSNRALAEAKVRFPECERAMRELVKQAH